MSKISVIVPVYKVEKYLHRCVNSILNQTFKDFELILVDDGSPDNCPAICDGYAEKDKRIKVIHQANQGVSVARNVGIEYSLNTDSKWITFIDSDDWVHPQYLEILYKACIDNNVKIACCGIQETNFDINSYETYNLPLKVEYGNADNLFCEHGLQIWTAWARIYDKNIFLKERFPFGKLFEDAYIIYKLLYSEQNIVNIKGCLYYYYISNNSITRSKTNLQELERLSLYINEVQWLYEKGFHDSCIKILNLYKCQFKDLIIKVKDNREILKKSIKQAKKTKKFLIRKFKSEMDNELKDLNEFLIWVIKYRKNIFYSDYQVAKQNKGRIYAFLWGIKNFWKKYF